VGFLGRTRRAPSPPARGLRERCKLPQWGTGRSAGRNRFWCISKLVEGIKTKRCVICFCVSNFSLKFRGCSNTQNTPPLVTALDESKVSAGARCCSDIEHAARRLRRRRAPARRARVRRRRRVLLRGGRVVRVGRGVAGPALRADVDADRRHVGPLPPPPPTSPLANAR